MIDRIVPATAEADLDAVERLTGVRDPGAVVHEPFRQWVIEDDFVDGVRPAFQVAGVQMVDDVAPFEHMKLRCLNGTHSALAYLGVLAGKRTVAEAVADPAFRGFIERLWADEIIPSLVPPPGEDVARYVTRLMQRYRNPGIEHRTIQIAMDGSQKLPQRILAPVADNLAAGRPVDGLCLVVAAWVRFLRGVSDTAVPHAVNDPLADDLQVAALGDNPVAAVLAMRDVVPPVLADDARFRAAVQDGYDLLAARGVAAALQAGPG
jgi:fructuronate reductase